MTIVEQVLQKLNIEYTAHSRGQWLSFRCIHPKHNDRNASCNINVISGLWHCWSCPARGNLQMLVNMVDGTLKLEDMVSEEDAVLLQIDSIYSKSMDRVMVYEKINDFKRDIEYIQRDFISALDNKDAREYLYNRNLNDETIREFNLMFAIRGEYKDRVIIPYYIDGEMIGFNSRHIGDGHRYLYFVDKNRFNGFIYNLGNVESRDSVILVEGPFDLMYMWQCGFKNVISTLNTSMNNEHMNKIFEFDKIIFCFDNDPISKAGDKAVLQHSKEILKISRNKLLFKVSLPNDKDDETRKRDPNNCSIVELLQAFKNITRIKIKK